IAHGILAIISCVLSYISFASENKSALATWCSRPASTRLGTNSSSCTSIFFSATFRPSRLSAVPLFYSKLGYRTLA
ncbi:hypothetical protein PMAYCL1PPCAC_11157, partial [Pristionchus mayeri]